MSASKAKVDIGIEVGEKAPEFELKDGEGLLWRLSDYHGRVVVLLFYPRDQTSVCTKQMCSVRDRWTDYESTGAEVVGISIGSVESHKSFSERYSLPQRLLADADGHVAKLFKVKSILGTSQRAVIVMDRDGIIRFKRSIFPFFRPADDDVLEEIRKVSGQAGKS